MMEIGHNVANDRFVTTIGYFSSSFDRSQASTLSLFLGSRRVNCSSRLRYARQYEWYILRNVHFGIESDTIVSIQSAQLCLNFTLGMFKLRLPQCNELALEATRRRQNSANLAPVGPWAGRAFFSSRSAPVAHGRQSRLWHRFGGLRGQSQCAMLCRS